MAENTRGEEVYAKRIGDIVKVKNTKRKFGANAAYNYARLQLQDGTEQEFLFSDHQLEVALKRAQKNPEDLPEINWLRDLID